MYTTTYNQRTYRTRPSPPPKLPFYPGGNWIRRGTKLLFIYLIPFNLFISEVNDQLLNTATEITTWSITKSNEAVNSADYLGQKLATKLSTLQQSSYGWIIDQFGLPTDKDIESGLIKLKNQQDRLVQFGNTLNTLSIMLKWISIGLWLQIAYSVYWLLCDVFLGQAKGFVFITSLLAVLFYFYASAWLEQYQIPAF